MGKKKNRSNNAEDKDQVIAKLQQQLEESQKVQKELQKKLDRLLEGLLPPESGGGAAPAAAKKKKQEDAARKAAEKKKAAEKEKAWHLRKAAEQEKENSKLAGDALDEEWEIVNCEAKKEKSRAEKSRAEVSIHGATLLPAQSAASKARDTPVTQADGLDPRDWNVELRPATGKERLKVGQDGLVLARGAREIEAVLHDLQSTDAKAAMLSYDKTPDGILAPVRFWKDGKAALKRLWLTHLGTGENVQVQYIGTMKEEDDGEEQEAEEWEEELSTEVMVLRVHQAWCSKETWAMWAPTATRMTVARKWLRRQKLEGYVEPEGLFHPRVYGTEPTAVASISVRIDITHTHTHTL